MVAQRFNAIAIVSEHTIDGQLVIQTNCPTFDTFAALPDVVEYKGQHLVKTGWSSDSGFACYKTGMPFAKTIAKAIR